MTRKKTPRRCKVLSTTYSPLDILTASLRPMNAPQREAYIAGFRAALDAIQFAPVSTPEHWRIMADAVNLTETFCAHPWPDPEEPGQLIDIADEAGAIAAATLAMQDAARAHGLRGGSIRLSAQGREALAALVDLLDTILQTVSHRSALLCHNETEKAIAKQRRQKGAVVVSL